MSPFIKDLAAIVGGAEEITDPVYVVNGMTDFALRVIESDPPPSFTFNGCVDTAFDISGNQPKVLPRIESNGGAPVLVRSVALPNPSSQSIGAYRRFILNGCSRIVIDYCLRSCHDELAEHQQACLDAVLRWFATDAKLSQVVVPVAGGKTFLLPYFVDSLAEQHGVRCFGVGMPWIPLSDETVRRMFDTFARHHGADHSYRIVLVHSGSDPLQHSGSDSLTYSDYNDKFVKSVSPDHAVKTANQWLKDGMRVIIAYSYKSAQRLFDAMVAGGLRIEVAFHDEAHNLSRDRENLKLIASISDEKLYGEFVAVEAAIRDVQASWRADPYNAGYGMLEAKLRQRRIDLLRQNPLVLVDPLPLDRILSMTATPTSAEARGETSMDNVDIFGECIYRFSFRQLRDVGLAVPADVRILAADQKIAESIVAEDHLTTVNRKIQAEHVANIWYIIQAVKAARAQLKGDLKVIVYLRSLRHIEAITGERLKIDKRKLRDPVGYDAMLATSSQQFQAMLHDECGWTPRICLVYGKHSPDERRDRFAEFEKPGDALFLNCKGLAEGVDFPDANVIVLLRSASGSEVVQIFGRGARISRFDRRRISDGSLTPHKDRVDYTKHISLMFIGERLNADIGGLKAGDMKQVIDRYQDGDYDEVGSGNAPVRPIAPQDSRLQRQIIERDGSGDGQTDLGIKASVA